MHVGYEYSLILVCVLSYLSHVIPRQTAKAAENLQSMIPWLTVKSGRSIFDWHPSAHASGMKKLSGFYFEGNSRELASYPVSTFDNGSILVISEVMACKLYKLKWSHTTWPTLVN